MAVSQVNRPGGSALAPIGLVSGCILAATAGCAAAVALARPDLAAIEPLCTAQPEPVQIVGGIAHVVALDLDKRYLTVVHDEMRRLSMPAMRMMFEARHRALLEPLKPGDQIRFMVDRSDMQITNIAVIRPAD
jgi:Cu/Ag efflux protein CusF